MIVGHQVFYSNWNSNIIKPLDIKADDGSDVAFSCVYVMYVEDDDPELFELVLGSDCGRIFMRTIMIESAEANDI